MNILNGGCLSRCRRVTFSIPYVRDALKPSSVVVVDNKHETWKTNTKIVERLQSASCTSNFHAVLVQWTQIRFQGDCPPPKFHRDIAYPNYDAYRKEDYTDVRKTTWGSGDGKPGITYALGFFGYLLGAYAAKTIVYDLVTYMSAPADVLALASIEVDISKVAPGGCLSYKWRGKPLFIKNRTDADIELESKTPVASLRHPQSPEDRCVKPEWLVVIGICTHLGCVPIPNSGDWGGGFYCPCHGSHYDNLGRARKGPAPLNLEVPPYKFVSDTLIIVG
ncbi:unnamed protein product [Diatraea saccharalis]|uniref:Cytochrome b-c1 complex subunit Rieske, mitochondrial n=1 Tax=Diatraea saccharalis TaxID=40085 RepID=A0A9N9QKK2_9NEOP|nr:unnamed protein product [Diatraea saccharalis]